MILWARGYVFFALHTNRYIAGIGWGILFLFSLLSLLIITVQARPGQDLNEHLDANANANADSNW